MKAASPLIRMVFEMTREDHPRLYDDLIRFPKGTKRVNRLRTLAHDGLLLQAGLVAYATSGDADRPVKAADQGASSDQIFDEPLSE